MSISANWIKHEHLFEDDEYECTACGYMSDKPYTVCPRCGAGMTSVKYDPSFVDEAETLDIIFNG